MVPSGQRLANEILASTIETLKKIVGFRSVNRDSIKLEFGTNNRDEIERQLSEYGL